MSGDLAGWLLTQISEDEAVVRGGYPFDSWENHEEDYAWDSDALMASWHTARCGHRYGESMTYGQPPCSCDVPARILAECAAKRAIIAACYGDDPTQGDFDPRYADERIPALVLRALAQPYSDRPGFRPEWQVTP